MELGDATGRIPAVLWDEAEETAKQLEPGMIVKVRGFVSTYQDRPQVRVEKIRPAGEDEYSLADFFRQAGRNKEELAGILDAVIGKIENSYLKKLLEAIFTREDIRDKYLSAPAAKLLHHDFPGGLAEHSLSMCEIIVRLADHYAHLDRDILIAGALLHDIGKIWEYSIEATIDYTDAGRLIGHINQGDEFVTGMADTIEHFPEALLNHLRHLIISHQGERMKGSPVAPQTPEAMFLHAVDEMDAYQEAVMKIKERAGGVGWSEYSKIFERFFFFGPEEPDSGEQEELDL
jgi:3'-5' exoribonuclease